uniref:LITAF domain-containing protein n=1 Tax=Caenorhabditis tropicalis TaxID=1561998 RepID=A0A1I7TFQ8_9PELO
MIRIRRLLSLLLFLFPLNHCSPTCPYHIDGPLCQNDSECTGISKCFFGNNSTLGWGRCCAVDQGSYYNAIFDLLIDDPESRIPGELFSPVGKDTCESSKDCLHSEVCMVSKRKGDSDPLNKKNNTQDEKNGILKMEELDEINKNDGEWIMDFKDTIQLFHSNASDCKITFKGKRDKSQFQN